MAEKANRDGNAHYKAGNLLKAGDCYLKAENIDPGEPKYASNLSATLYEQGQYTKSIDAILRSWSAIKAKNQPNLTDLVALQLKLATRYAKANLQIVAEGTIPHTSDGDETRADIELFAAVDRGNSEDVDVKFKDMTVVWDQWLAVQSNSCSQKTDDLERTILDAQRRLRALRIYKHTSDPTLEHYTFGHDEIRSLMDSVEKGDTTLSLKLKSLAPEKQTLSFLFGGSGDARHVFATICDIADQVKKMRASKEDYQPPKIHMTLVDIHPATLARTLLIFELLRRIMTTEEFKEKAEFGTALFYVYVALVMPAYSHNIVIDVAKSLVSTLEKNPGSQPEWLHVNTAAVPEIIKVLRYWSTPLKKSTQTLLQLHKGQKSMQRGIQLYEKVPIGPVDPHFQPWTEDTVFDAFRVLLPQKFYMRRHPALEKFVAACRSPPKDVVIAARKEIRETWFPNPTLFDEKSTEHPQFGQETGYPCITMDPYKTLFTLSSFYKRIHSELPMTYGCIAYSIVNGFFWTVTTAIEALKDVLKIEIVLAEAVSGFPRLVAGDFGTRPKGFPNSFDRIWLSNVPDYTNGILNNAIHILPCHESESQVTSFNCLLNTAAFRTANDLCYNYTLLSPSELPQFLGCRLVSPNANSILFGAIISLAPQKLPLSADQLASKAKLYHWLSHYLLCLLCNGNPVPSPRIVFLPNNLNAFFRLLVHLHKVGYPAHWLGEFVQRLVSDDLTTTALPYLKWLPIPPSERHNTTNSPRKVNLKPWQAELEVILANVAQALPFYVPTPREWSPLTDIQTYKAHVTPVDLERHRLFQHWAPLSSPFVMTVGLIFYQPNPEWDGEELAHAVSMLLEGDAELTAFGVQIMLRAENIDLSKREIVWKMSRQWYEKMRAEKWNVVAYRTDLAIAVSEPLSANLWRVVP